MSDFKPFIVIIDDEIEIAEMTAKIFDATDVPVKIFSDADQALEFITDHASRILMVLSDYRMPGMNGIELRKKLLEAKVTVPFVIISGFVSRKMLEEGIESKILRFIDKPIEEDELLKLFESECRENIEILEEKAFLSSTFCTEAQDLFEELEPMLLELENHPDDLAEINNIFRIVHTIKGGSSVVDWREFTTFCHHYEDLLSKLKKAEITADQAIISKLLTGMDYLGTLIGSLGSGRRPEVDLEHWKTLFDHRHHDSEKAPVSQKEAQKAERKSSSKEEDTIKVPTRILDEFMELSGEITVIRNTVNKLVTSLSKTFHNNEDLSTLAEMLEEMNKVNGAMQAKITDLRKIPLSNVFRVYPRTIRDLCNELEKKIQLEFHGAELRVDTKIGQVLSNSLIHVVRNCADHGIEPPLVRKERGKPEQGTILLSAEERGEDVVILVKDDGGGIDPDKIRSIAVEKGLYTKDQVHAMADKQVFDILFESGFSTAKAITDISGRGVGMDMVKTSVLACGGEIEVDSKLGQGSSFRFRLPIPKSVLIIPSLLVKAGGRSFNVPQDNIDRLLVYSGERKKAIKTIEGVRVVELDGKLVQIVPLKEVLNLPPAKSEEEVSLIVVRHGHQALALQVDEICNTEEIVVKKLHPAVGAEGLYLGATFMGDGSVGLILDTEAIAGHYLGDTKEVKIHHALEDSMGEGEEQSFLICGLKGGGHYCIKLKEVFRLEEFSLSKLKKIDGISTIIYRRQSIPVVDLPAHCGLEPLGHEGTAMAVIYKEKNFYAALLVHYINQLVTTKASVVPYLRRDKGIIGTVVLQEKIYSILDPATLIEPYHQEIKHKEQPVASQTEEPSKGEQSPPYGEKTDIEGLFLF